MRRILQKSVLVILGVLLLFGAAVYAGSLTPSGSVASTMHSLGELWNTIASSTYDSSAVVANQNGSLLGNLKYIEANLPISVWGSGSNNIWSLNSGNVGIGTTTPAYKLEIGTPGDINIASSGAGLYIGSVRILSVKGSSLGDVWVGPGTGASNSSGYRDTAIGDSALSSNTNGFRNTAIGYGAMFSNVGGSQSTAVGDNALYSMTGGGAAGNSALGQNALYSNTTGYHNTAIGQAAAYSTTVAAHVTALGWNALYANTASYNTAVGAMSLVTNTTGVSNTAVGYYAARFNDTGSNNTAVGITALNNGSNYSNTTALGYSSGFYASASNNTFLGASADVVGVYKAGLITNSIAIGSGTKVAASRQLVVGADNGSNYLTEAFFGSGVSASAPQAFRINATSGRGTNVAGANMTFAAGSGTGTANGGSLFFQTASASVSGSTTNPLSTRMAITPAGNVGIGTTTPSALLYVTDTSGTKTALQVERNFNNAYGPSIQLYQNRTGGAIVGDETGYISWMFNNSASAQKISAQIVSSLNNVTAGSEAANLEFRTQYAGAATTKMIIRDNGNVGIGILGGLPAKLSIVGSAGNYDLLNIASSTNASVFRVTKAGNVGIGTATPAVKLDVSGTASISGSLEVNATSLNNNNGYPLAVYGQGFLMTNSSDTTFQMRTNNPSNTNLFSIRTSAGGTGPSSNVYINTQNGAPLYLGANSAGGDGSTVRHFTIISSGNVGIGANNLSPDARLDVTGNILASSTLNVDLILRSSTATGDDGKFTIRSAGANDQLRFLNGAGTVAAVIASNSDFRVGNRLYIARADVAGDATSGAAGYLWYTTNNTLSFVPHTGASIFQVSQVGSYAGGGDHIEFGSSFVLIPANTAGVGATLSNVRLNVAGLAGNNDIFNVASASTVNYLRVIKNGNVGIGPDNLSPNATLDVKGNITASTSGSVDIILRSSSRTADDGMFSLRSISTTDRLDIMGGAGLANTLMTIASLGYTVIGTASTPDGDVLTLTDADGSCAHNPGAGTEVVACSSDVRLKTNILDAPSALAYLSGFHIRSYTVIASGKTTTGVIAQELLQTHPELVSSGSNGFLTVQQPNPWVLVKGIQELTASSLMLDQLLTPGPISTAPDGPLARLVNNILAFIDQVLGVHIGQGEVKADKLCAGDTCVNSQQLQQLLEMVGSSPSTPAPTVTSTPSPTASPTPDATPSDIPTPSATPDATVSPTPSPTDTPSPTSTP